MNLSSIGSASSVTSGFLSEPPLSPGPAPVRPSDFSASPTMPRAICHAGSVPKIAAASAAHAIVAPIVRQSRPSRFHPAMNRTTPLLPWNHLVAQSHKLP